MFSLHRFYLGDFWVGLAQMFSIGGGLVSWFGDFWILGQFVLYSLINFITLMQTSLFAAETTTSTATTNSL